MVEIKKTGGAKIGYSNATWPFVTFVATEDKIELKASILGRYIFRPSDVISLEASSNFLKTGLKINHSVSNYPQDIIFWTSNPEALISQIQQLGFFENTSRPIADLEEQITITQAQGGFPIKKLVVIAMVIIWNMLFFFDLKDFFTGSVDRPQLGIGVKLALGIFFTTCLLTLLFKPFAKLILKEGRTANDLKLSLFFIMLICGMMLLTTFLH